MRVRGLKGYHDDVYVSSEFYHLQKMLEHYTCHLVARARLPLELVELGLNTVGVVEEYRATGVVRFDAALVRKHDRAVVAVLEITGDRVLDAEARFLTEKVSRAKNVVAMGIPFWFIYYKIRPRTGELYRTKIFDLDTVVRYGRVGKWKDGERPYYHVELRHGLTVRQFVPKLKQLPSEIGKSIPLIRIDELLR